jgi:hypothetical protein
MRWALALLVLVTFVASSEAVITPTKRNCVACIVFRESLRRSEAQDRSDVMTCSAYDDFVAARRWPLLDEGSGKLRISDYSSMSQAYPADTANKDVACAEIRKAVTDGRLALLLPPSHRPCSTLMTGLCCDGRCGQIRRSHHSGFR